MFVQVFIFIASAVLVSASDSCCKNYNETFILSNDTQNWHQALINCASIGMKLATIIDKEDNDNLNKFLSENGNPSYYYWVGATNLGNGNYYWAETGEKMVYTNWGPLDPTNYDNEHCIFVDFNLKWLDAICDVSEHYICEKEPCCAGDCSKSNSVCWCDAN